MANKKISELPIVVDNIYKLSDNDVVAMVSASTTAQITIKTLRDKITEFAAKTGSANTFTGNQIVNGSVTITGKLTVNDIETIYQTSSVVFSSGSNKFGDQSSDKHEFTGSVNMTGSLIVNGDSVNIATLNQFTSSQLGVNLGTSIVTASFNSFSSSQLGVNLGNSIVTASFNSFSSSQLGVNLGTSIVTASFNAFSSSQLGVNLGTSIVTASFNSFSSSQLGVNLGVSIVTASFNQHSQSISDTVANIQAYTASVKVEVGQLVSYTASLNTFTASGKIDVANIQAYTASVKEEISQTLAYTASVKETISQTLAYTASVKNEVANIQAYTASVKETISQTLAYTASVKNEVANIQAYTGSVKYELGQIFTYTGSVKNEIGQIVSYTASLNVFTSSAKLDISGIQSYTQSLKTSGIVSGSQQITEYNTFAVTSSANTFYGNQTISGSLRVNGPIRGNIITGGLDVNGGVTGSFKGNLDGIANYASTVAVANTGTTTDTNLFPIFSLSPVLASYTNLYSHASSSFFYNGVTRRVHMEGLVVSGSNNIVEISGSFNVTGSTVQIGNNTLTGNTILSGSINVSGSTTFNGAHILSGSNTIDGNTIMTGTNTIIGDTVMSGSIEVSGSSNFHNSIFIVTGSTYFTGSHDVKGNSTITGSLSVTGNLTVASGSGFYRAGNKLFNYGQWGSLESQSGSANVANAMKFGTSFNGSEGITVTNNGSGFPTRITAQHTGLYNIQFSAQLHTTANEACQFSVWFAMTGSNMINSNTEYTVEKISGGGNSVAALNLLTSIEANDWVELYWSNATGNGQLQYIGTQSTPTRPATPSVIVTVTQVA